VQKVNEGRKPLNIQLNITNPDFPEPNVINEPVTDASPYVAPNTPLFNDAGVKQQDNPILEQQDIPILNKQDSPILNKQDNPVSKQQDKKTGDYSEDEYID